MTLRMRSTISPFVRSPRDRPLMLWAKRVEQFNPVHLTEQERRWLLILSSGSLACYSLEENHQVALMRLGFWAGYVLGALEKDSSVLMSDQFCFNRQIYLMNLAERGVQILIKNYGIDVNKVRIFKTQQTPF